MAYKPKITPRNMGLFTAPAVELYRSLELNIYRMVAEHLSSGSMDYDKDTAWMWRVAKMDELNLINSETIDLLSKTTGKAREEIAAAISAAGYATVNTVDSEMKKAGVKPKG